MTARGPARLIHFWREAGPRRWFGKNKAFDASFRATFEADHFRAARRALDHWMASPDGALALTLLLDQFPRNAYRGSAHMFATDPLARHFAKEAIAAGHDAAFEAPLRAFFYMPLVHSESPADQIRAVELYLELGPPQLQYALQHRDVIARFGRFPHRNPMLGRTTSPQEQAFLDSGGFAG